MIVQSNELVDVTDAVADLSNRGVLESALGVLTAVVEDPCLFVDVVELKRLQLPALTELHVLQPFDPP